LPPEKKSATASPSEKPAEAVPPLAAGKQKSRANAEKKAPIAVTVPPVASVTVPAAEVAENAQTVQIPDVAKPEAPTPMTQEEVDKLAKNLLEEAREAFGKADYSKAINRLNRVLGLPGNGQTESAQALMGEVREKNGEIAKARAEYDLYLKLYPNGSDAARIKQRLAALPAADVAKPRARVVRDDKPAEWLVFGSVSSYYFTGRSQQDSGPMRRDQESLVSSINLNARLRDSVTDTRIVFRDTDSQNFKTNYRNYNRIYSAYAERTDREVGYFVRAGRQNPNGGGVLERFDGITGAYNLNSDWRVNAVVGNSVEFPSSGSGWFDMPVSKRFYGGGVELLPQVGRPGVNLYAIEQTLSGYLNRRAVGAEVRYFDGQFSGFGTYDYDLLYKGTNVAAFQGNYLDKWGNNYFVSYDYRKSPSYSLTNALSATSALGITNVSDLIGNFGMAQSRTLVVDNTPTTKNFGAGVTVPVGERWQFGADYRMSSTTGTNATLPLNQVCKSLGFNALDPNDPICVGGPLGDTPVSQLCAVGSYDANNNTCQAGQAAQGTTNTVSLQAIGTNLFLANAVGVASASFSNSAEFSGQNYGLNYMLPLSEVWRLESNLRYFSSKSNNGSGQTNFSPAIKLGYQWRSSVFLEGEVGYSDQKSTGLNPGQNKREYIYLGLRWDYR
jgi:tetratricopeptide (TPR) repeat protein